MAFSQGSTVLASDYNSLFTALERIRREHNTRADVNITSKISGSVSAGTKTIPSQITAVKNAVTKLENGINNMSGFASQITIPSAGSLLTVGNVKSVVDRVDNVCVNCSFNNSFNSSFNSGFNSSFNSGFNSGFNSSFNSGFNSSNDSHWSPNFGSFNSSWNGVFC